MRLNSNQLLDIDTRSFFPHLSCDTTDCIDAAAVILFANRVSEQYPLKFYTHRIETVEEIPSDSICLTARIVSASAPAGWEDVVATKVLERRGLHIKAYRDVHRRRGVMMFESGDIDMAAALLPSMAPHLMKQNPLTDWEKQFVTVLSTGDGKAVSDMMSEYITRENLSAKIKATKIDKFFAHIADARLSGLKKEEHDLWERICHFESEIRRLTVEANELGTRILGITAGTSDEHFDGLRAMLIGNPNCRLITVGDTDLTYCLYGFATNFNKESYLTISRELHSILYDYAPSSQRSGLKDVYDALFLGNRYRVRMYGSFTMDLGNHTVQLRRGMGEADHALPNPHIVHYSCAGGFAAMYREAMRSGDYEDLLDIGFSEVQNINWSDYSPVGRFARDFCQEHKNTKCIWDKQEGKYLSPKALCESMGVTI